MRYNTPGPNLDILVLQHEASILRDHTIVASFLGKRIPPHAIPDEINRTLGFQGLSFRMDMSRGFLFLSSTDARVTREVLSFTPHATQWGTCVYHEWVSGFDPDNPCGLKIPSWISLVKLPHEFKPFEGFIASALGPVYQADPVNNNRRDSRFCIGIGAAFG
ncbi:hypothetical protein M758_UG110400 [Ceratodon purpureus]|nr:hypothetical protein M758_UG110400 [Ceratodon purpureus]